MEVLNRMLSQAERRAYRARTPYLETRLNRASPPQRKTGEADAEFGVGVNEKRVAIGAPKRPYTAPTEIEPFEESPNPLIRVARREGFASTMRPSRIRAMKGQPSWPITPDPQVRRIIRG